MIFVVVGYGGGKHLWTLTAEQFTIVWQVRNEDIFQITIKITSLDPLRICHDLCHSCLIHEILHLNVLPPHLRRWHQMVTLHLLLLCHRLLGHRLCYDPCGMSTFALFLDKIHRPDGNGSMHRCAKVLLRERHRSHVD